MLNAKPRVETNEALFSVPPVNERALVWDGAGTLLTSATVPAGTAAPLFGDFRTVPITPIVLPVGTGYTVGALFNVIDTADTQRFGWTGGVTAPGVLFGQGRFIINSVATLTRPTDTFPGITNGLTGGSFVTGVAVVPEAGAGLLALLGVPVLGFVVRRRK